MEHPYGAKELDNTQVIEIKLKDMSGNGFTRKGKVTISDQGIGVDFKGYSTATTIPDEGQPIWIELHDTEVKVHLWDNINDEDPFTLSMEGAREEFREDE